MHRIAGKDLLDDIRVLADAIPQLVWMAEPDGWIFWYNRRWHEYTGTSRQQMEGWGWQSVHNPEMLPRVMERWQQSIATGEAFEMEFPLRAADGHFGWFLTRVSPLRDSEGTIVRWYGTNTDISSLKEAEQALRETEAKVRRSEDTLRVALDAALLGIWDWDLASGELVWSDRCKGLFGIPPEVPITYSTFLDAIHPEDREWVDRAVQDSLRNNAGHSVVMRVCWPDGSLHWVALVGRVFCDESGKQVRMAGAAYDVTARQAVEERIRQSQKLESLGLLAGGVAHDFNNLLTGIMGGASVALEIVGEDSEAAPLLRNVVLSSERAAGLTRQMLAYSGKGQFLLQLVDISEQVRNTLPLVEHFISRKVTVRVECAEHLPHVQADESQLQQVILNLLINAGEAIGEAAGSIEVLTELEVLDEGHSRTVAESWHDFRPGTYVTLKVRDTGCGMDAATQAKIFDPFYTTKATGRGLGLAAIQGIVRGHQGAIRLTSEPGRGTSFEVLFPAAAASVPPSSTAGVNHQERSLGVSLRQTVLVVDDEEVVRAVARAALEARGYTVLTAENGEKAIDIFKSQARDVALVLLDLSMPGMSGKECLPLLREIRQDSRILICSGFNESDVISRFEEDAITGVLPKPFTAANLVAAVKAALV